MRIFFNSTVHVPPATAKSVRIVEKRTHINDLSLGREHVWENLRTFCKKNIKKAEKNNLKVFFDDDYCHLDDYIDLVQKLYDDQGIPNPKPLHLYHRLYAPEHRKNIRILFVTCNDTIIGGLIIAISKTMVNAMEWCIQQGYERFDFTGSDIDRLAQFKANFGGALTTYVCLEVATPKEILMVRDMYTKGKYKFMHAAYTIDRVSASAARFVRLGPLYARSRSSLVGVMRKMQETFGVAGRAKDVADIKSSTTSYVSRGNL
jgi:hypothetical protein